MGGRLRRRGCSWGEREVRKLSKESTTRIVESLPHSITQGELKCMFKTLIDEFCSSFPFPLGLVSCSGIAFAEARGIAACY